MADSDKRLRYYNGQFLQEQDFTAEQEYHLDRQRRHNRQLHTYGIAEGLTVTADVGATSATVSAGTAIDGEGRTIVLTESRNVPFGSLSGSVLVVISYSQQTSDPATVGDEGDTRWWERPDVEVIAESGAPAADVRIRLARLQIASNAVTQHDTSVRTSAGGKLGTEVAIERIRLSRQGVAQGQWPVLSSGAAGQADVTGNLAVSGTISGQLAAGIVGNAQLAANAVTAAKISDLSITTTKIADLAVATGKIADLAVATGKIADLGVTGAKIADNTIAEGKLDTAARGKLTDALPRTGGGTVTGNLAVTGNLDVNGLINGFATKSRFTHNFSFSGASADGATSVATPNFRARMILVHGSAVAQFDPVGSFNFQYGGLISGIALIGPNGAVDSQSCSGPEILRFTTGNFQWDTRTFSDAIAGTYFIRYYDQPQGTVYRSIQLTIFVQQVTATQVTFQLSRTFPVSGSTPPDGTGITVNATIFG